MKHKANRINESTTTISTVGAIHELPLQKDLPEGWVNTNLEDVVDILDRRRVPVNAEDRDKRRGTIPYYGATGQVGWIDDYLFNEELVLLGEDGAPFLEPTKQKAYIIRGKSWVNNHAHVLRARNGIPNAYIKYYLDIVDYHKFVSGTTRLKLNQSAMRQIPVPIAPSEQQQRIVAEIEKQFSRLDEAVAALKRLKANLKRYKASVLKAAVEGKLTEQWRKEHPDIETVSELLKRILAERRKKWEEDYVKKYIEAHGHAPKDDLWKKKYKEPTRADSTNLPELPKGWVWVIFLQLTSANKNSIKRGPFGSTVKKAFFVNKGYKVYEQQNAIYNNPKLGDYYIDEEKYNELIDFTVNSGDFIVSCSGTMGKIAEIPEGAEKGIINQALLKISVDKKVVLSKYFLYLFKSDGFQRSFLKDTRGTAMKNIASVEDIKNIPVALPSIKEQAVIVDEIERRLSVVEEMEAAIEIDFNRAERLRQSILKGAFSGKLVLQESNIGTE